ncbi:hypothetical protein F7984_11005 [Pradoshia sp. D12]|uniref:hypothetical protein n=1 Tax=Bacillaceae TaxID=186817 RepID=UPI00080AC527|nr:MULTISPECIES: hypothetical protein [Bacillaceae]OCA83478.1 hypothetical protein A8L44_11630 [Bacillus sp. FJAT-27986]QFK71719.1 hypothetical protein F7984_11005 [Pradoshia sp. D12]TPF73514.1 hypothetical protein FHY44_07405 [Bacillus sp. D12]
MNDNEMENNKKEPIFYIIQPVNKGKLIAQNMQEVYHSKGSIKEKEDNKLQEEYSLQEDEAAVKNELTEKLHEEALKKDTDNITENLFIGKTSQGEEDFKSDENIEVQVESDPLKDDLRMKLIRLARYPSVVEKPFCEIKIEGETLVGQIESKRGEFLKVKVDEKIRLIAIDDVDELSII